MFCIQNGSLAPALPLVNGVEHVDPRAYTEGVSSPRRALTLSKALPNISGAGRELQTQLRNLEEGAVHLFVDAAFIPSTPVAVRHRKRVWARPRCLQLAASKSLA